MGGKELGNLLSWLLDKRELFVDLAELGVGEIVNLGGDWGGDVVGLCEKWGEWLEETEGLLRVREGLLGESEALSVGEGVADDGVGGDVGDGFGEWVLDWGSGGSHCSGLVMSFSKNILLF